ncbi:MAG: DUF2911 domain-containing protein [Gemmatimonadales bacterium]|nr:DUF2911 domain-containing protein [Gemmatimonadales bacterium]
MDHPASEALRKTSLTSLGQYLAIAVALVVIPSQADGQGYGFLTLLGHDTLALERVTPTPNGFTADLLERSPRVARSRFQVELEPGTRRLRRYEIVLQGTAASAPRASDRMVVELVGNAIPGGPARYSLRNFRGDSLLRQTDTLVAEEVLPWLLTSGATFELMAQTLRLRGGDSLPVANMSSNMVRLAHISMLRGTDTTFVFPYGRDYRYHGVLDAAGRLTALSGRETTVKFELRRLQIPPIIEPVWDAWRVREEREGAMTALSRRDTTSLAVGTGHLAVDYGRPLARGRVVAGGLVPYGEVWRTGANGATHLTTTVPLLINGQRLEAGRYAFWTRPTPVGATLLLSSQVNVWGTAYQADRTILEAPFESLTPGPPVEQLEIRLVPDGAAVAMTIRWGTLAWRLQMQCAGEGTTPVRCS